MRDQTWRRGDQITALRDRIWKYLTPAAQIEQLTLDAAALLQLPEEDVLTLARIQFLLHERVTALVDELPSLARRLTTTTTQVEERSTERVRGTIHWSATLAARNATQLHNLFVTSPVERAYETPENELLVYVLDEIAAIGTQSGWDDQASELGQRVRHITTEARRWRSNRMLLQIEGRPPSPRSVARVRTGRARRRYANALTVYDLHRELISRLDRHALRALVEGAGLTTRSDATLFELLCTFAVIDSLQELGWKTTPLRLFQGRLRLEGQRGNDRLTLWYQTAPKELRRSSRYTASLRHHDFERPIDLRPDLVLQRDDRWLIVECKLGTRRGAASSVRASLIDLLAYRTAFEESLDRAPSPYGLGVAWGTGLIPAAGSDVMLCTPEHIKAGIATIAG